MQIIEQATPSPSAMDNYPIGKSIFKSKTFWRSVEQLIAAAIPIAMYAINTEDLSNGEVLALTALAFADLHGFAGVVDGRTRAKVPAFSPPWLPGHDRDDLLGMAHTQALSETPQPPVYAPPVYTPAPAPVEPAPTLNQERDSVDAMLLYDQQSAEPPEETGAAATPPPEDLDGDIDALEHEIGILDFMPPEAVKYYIKALKETQAKTSVADSSELPPGDRRRIQEGHLVEIEAWKNAAANHLRADTMGQSLYFFRPDVQILGPDQKPLVTAQPATPAQAPRWLSLPGNQRVDLDAPIIPDGNFTWSEATKDGSRIPVNTSTVSNIVSIAREMQWIRGILGDRAIQVNSWYRDPATNRRVGGASKSQHLTGNAIDFVVAGMSPQAVHRKLLPLWGQRGGIASATVFTHLDLRGYAAEWSYGF